MTNLSKNIKKYFVTKLIDILFVLGLMAVILVSLMYFGGGNQYIALLIIALEFVILYFVNVEIVSWMDKWKVPDLESQEKRTYNLVDTYFYGITAAVIVYLLWNRINNYLLLGIMLVAIGIREYKKWKGFPKIKIVDDEDSDYIGIKDQTADEQMAAEDAREEEKKKEDQERQAELAHQEVEEEKKKEEVITTIRAAKTTVNPEKVVGED